MNHPIHGSRHARMATAWCCEKPGGKTGLASDGASLKASGSGIGGARFESIAAAKKNAVNIGNSFSGPCASQRGFLTQYFPVPAFGQLHEDVFSVAGEILHLDLLHTTISQFHP